MIALQRILVPHDFTSNAAAALDTALRLARMFDASCEALHVVERAGTDAGDEAPNGVQVQFRNGVPHLEIIQYASEHRIDLIVMGTHGRRGLAHAVLGSVAERVVRMAPCPVLTVHGRAHDVGARDILVATDFGAVSETAVVYARTLAHLFGATLHLLHVVENYFLRPVAGDPHTLVAAAQAQVAAQLTSDDRDTLRATAVLEMSDSPADAIVDYARHANIDLIVMGTHGRQALDRFLIGSVAERVVRLAPCHVLTVRHPEREFIKVDAGDREADAGGMRR